MIGSRQVQIFLCLCIAALGLVACAESDTGAPQTFQPPEEEGPETPLPPPGPADPEVPSEPPPTTTPGGPQTPRGPKPKCVAGMQPTHWHSQVLRINHGWVTIPLQSCAPDGIIAIIPRGTTWEFTVRNLVKGDVVRVYTPHYFTDEHVGELRPPQVVSPAPNADGQTVFSYTGVHGGEHVIIIESKDPESIIPVVLNSRCVENCDRITTRFPLVMVHGFLGTDNYLGILDYWSGIIPPLRKLGMEVYTPSSSLVNSSTVRAQSVVAQMDDALAETGARKVNLIGHSQGGLDSRIIISSGGLNRSSNVDSLTTIATPHHGVPIPLLDVASSIINLIFDFPDFSEAEAKTFNKRYIDAPDTTYYSWSFRTCDSVDYLCHLTSGGEKVNSLLEIFFRAIKIATLGGDNDGLVTVKSAKWGPKENQFGPVWADHMDQIGQIARFPNSEAFNHVTFYQDWARTLIMKGH